MTSSGHSHHVPSGDAAGTRALAVSGWLTGLYFVIELGIGIWSGSVAVLSDAFHTFSAVGGVLIALAAARLASRPADVTASFGWVRAEIIGALLNGVFLFGMAILVLWMGTMRLMSPIEVASGPMLVAATGGLITEFISIRLLYHDQKGNLNVRGAFWHILQTFVGSLIIIVAALVIRFTGFYAIDPILGMAFGFVLLWAGWGVTRDATRILLDHVPEDLDLHALIAAVEAMGPVRNVHHPHAWALTSGKNVVSMHVLIDDWARADELQATIHTLLEERFGVYFSTVQLETQCLDQGRADDIAVTL